MICVSEIEFDIIINILKKHVPKYEVRAFGSRYKWTNKDYSDLDLLIMSKTKMSLNEIGELEEAFEESDLPFSVDVLDFNAISYEFKAVIDRGFEVIYNGVDWETVKLGDVCDKMFSGGTPLTKNFQYYLNGTINWLKTKEVNYKRIYNTENFISLIGLEKSSAKMVPVNSVIMAMYGQGDTAGRVAINKIELTTNQACCNMIINKERAYYEFIYYQLKLIYREIVLKKSGSAQPNLNLKIINDIEVTLPPIKEQKAIADILSCLDSKIELNNRINRNLEETAQAIFKRWFVDFEFPDENGLPFKSSGGKMVDSEMGEIPEGWTVGTLGDNILLFDSKRIPLSTRQRKDLDKIYPYYGATSIIDYVDNYIFEGTYILMGEDGSVINENEKPFLQYVWGKFWVNNHAHVIKGKDPFSDEYILLFLKELNVKEIVTGAVQLKINQGNLCNVKIIVPKEPIVRIFNKITTHIYKQYKNYNEQTQTLTTIRDTLLPKLMSGEVRVPIK